MRIITLGDGMRVPLKAYLKAVKLAKANSDRRFNRSLEGPWQATGAEIMREFRTGMHDRINQARPYSERGLR